MLLLGDFFETLVNMPMPGPMFLLMAIVGIVAILAAAVTKIAVSRGRERTRREIAAYVAEGSIDPDKAIAMLNAGAEDECCKKSAEPTVVIGAASLGKA